MTKGPLDAAHDAISAHSAFNLVDTAHGMKVALFVLGDGLLDPMQIERRIAVAIPGIANDVWVTAAEDQVLRKLDGYRSTGHESERQWRDVLGILRIHGDSLDHVYLDNTGRQVELDDASCRRAERRRFATKVISGVSRMDTTIQMADGRTVGFADFGPPDAVAVLWCHGGPGSRLEPAFLDADAVAAGLRIVGIDRPGYGLSTTQPGRTIAGWVPDALAVADQLDLAKFIVVGTSTGGAYALATAALAPDRVLGVVACCAVTDMRAPEPRATMSAPHAHALWDAPDRRPRWRLPSTYTARTGTSCSTAE